MTNKLLEATKKAISKSKHSVEWIEEFMEANGFSAKDKLAIRESLK